MNKTDIGIVGIVVVAVVSFAVLAQRNNSTTEDDRFPREKLLVAEIIERFPHDPKAFTQGLAINQGNLFESTGQYGQSSLRQVDLTTGKVERITALNSAFFAEGIAVIDDRIYQLTWQRQTGVIYDAGSFEVIGTFRYDGEGWGLTNDGTTLILSDGTAQIRFLDSADFSVNRTINVHDDSGPVERLNELEYIHGEIWANIWYEDSIVRIDPANGQIIGRVDLSKVYPASLRSREAVANGIAYDSATEKLYVTGKNWPALFEIRLTTSSQ